MSGEMKNFNVVVHQVRIRFHGQDALGDLGEHQMKTMQVRCSVDGARRKYILHSTQIGEEFERLLHELRIYGEKLPTDIPDPDKLHF